jgi:prepilin-type N-terminal cleavage/methylation domain-containing protein
VKVEETAKQKGFTLLEVLLAMAIAGISLLALAMMQGTAIEGNVLGRRYTRATFLAQDTLECLMDGHGVPEGTYGFMDMAIAATATPKASGKVCGVTKIGEPGGPFDIHWQIFPHTEWSRKIEVAVSWKSMAGTPRTVKLVSISRGDVN